MKNQNVDSSKARLKKLASYATAATAMVAIGNSANAQTTVPFTVSGNTSVQFDIDGGGYDFTFNPINNSSTHTVRMSGSAANQVYGNTPLALNLGATIGSTASTSFFTSSNFVLQGNFTSGKKYLGVRIQVTPTSFRYGWVGITYNSPGSITVNDYYLSPTPNTPVYAGIVPSAAIPISTWSVALAGGLIGLAGLVAARRRAKA